MSNVNFGNLLTGQEIGRIRESPTGFCYSSIDNAAIVSVRT